MIKKPLQFLMGALILGIILVGCSDGNNEESEKSSNNNGDGVTIKFYTHGNEATYNWEETVEAFEEEHPDINVDVNILSESGDTMEAKQKLDLASSSDEEMDVLMFSNPADYAEYVSIDKTVPLEEFIDDEGYDMEDEYKVDTRVDDEYHALPGKFNPWYVILNKDHLDEAGLDVPEEWTWDDLQDYAKELTTDDHYGTYFHGPQNGSWMEYLKLKLASKSKETDLLKDDGSSNLDDPSFRETLELRYEMEKEDESATPYTEIMSSELDYRQQLFQQNTSTLLIGSWMTTELGGTDDFPLDFDIAVAPYPKNNEDDEGGYTPVTTDYLSIASNSEHKEEAYEFIRWYTTEGQLVQGTNVPSWSDVDDDELSDIIDNILENTNNPEKVDKESLVNVMSNSRASELTSPASYISKAEDAISDEYEKFIYGDQDIDEMIENANEKIEDIKAENDDS